MIQTTNADTAAWEGYQLLFDANPKPMWVFDVETLGFLAVNAAAVEVYGYTRDEFLGMTIADIRPGEDVAALLLSVAASEPHDIERSSGWRHRRKDGSIVEVDVASSALKFDGRAARLVQVDDVTSRNAAERLLTHQATHDPLTDLPNRALLLDRLGHALQRLERRPNSLAVLFFDVDRLKLVNDSLGHAVGDRMLVALADRVREAVRPDDTVARLSGDEFTVLCEDLTGAEDAAHVARRLLEAISEPLVFDGHEVFPSISMGIALTDDPSADPAVLLRDADAAMYRAKAHGGNRYELFDEATRADTTARLARTNQLRRAIERHELRVFYQPDLALLGERPTGVEALVRWQHPERGLVGPADFIELAEETGLVVGLGAWVLAEACKEVAAWDAEHESALTLSVNLSARQLNQPELIGTVRRALDESGLAPARLCLEITESVLMEDVDQSIDTLLALKTLGVRLAVDDFGTGYSSLSYLRRFPIDVVKIDRSFVATMVEDAAAAAIVAAVINLSHALGLHVVAEGIETEQQLIALRALRCERAQGYLWSKPLPAAEIRAWTLAAKNDNVSSTSVDVRGLVEQRLEMVRQTSGHPVTMQLPAKLPPAIGDPGAVRNVLDHLLANAVAYSATDRPIQVSAAADRRWVRVSVADFGIGMTADEAARCFEQFWQADIPGRRGGTGIGLYIVRSLVEAMGGHVGVKSAPGRGSTFTFSLPRSSRVAERSRAVQASAANPGMGVGEQSMVREFMRQIGVPVRREQ